MGRTLEILQTAFVQCRPGAARGTIVFEDVIEAVRAAGGNFLYVLEGGKVISHPNPMEDVNSEGDLISGVDFEHPILERSPFEHKIFADCHPKAGLDFVHEGGFVGISQGAEEGDCNKVDSLANGQLALARVLYPKLRPAFAYVDEMGMNSPGGRKTPNPDVKYILWTTFFSPPYVDRYGGRDFLLGAPVWKKEVLDDGGILLVVTESYFSWWSKPPKDIAAYWQQRFPNMKPFRAKS